MKIKIQEVDNKRIKSIVFQDMKEKEYKYVDEHINITEVVPSACLREAWFRRKLGIKDFEGDRTKIALWRGTVMDKEMNEKVENAGGQSQVHITIPCGDFTLSGYADWYFPDSGEVYEFKTIVSNYYLKDGAKQDHIYQVLAYAYALSAKKAYIVYFDIGDFKVFEVDVSKKEDVAMELCKRAKELYKSLKNNKPPYAKYDSQSWRCRACPYKDECRGKDMGKTIQELRDLMREDD